MILDEVCLVKRKSTVLTPEKSNFMRFLPNKKLIIKYFVKLLSCIDLKYDSLWKFIVKLLPLFVNRICHFSSEFYKLEFRCFNVCIQLHLNFCIWISNLISKLTEKKKLNASRQHSKKFLFNKMKLDLI